MSIPRIFGNNGIISVNTHKRHKVIGYPVLGFQFMDACKAGDADLVYTPL
jgi:hypothetical protein